LSSATKSAIWIDVSGFQGGALLVTCAFGSVMFGFHAAPIRQLGQVGPTLGARRFDEIGAGLRECRRQQPARDRCEDE
jgi:hypothetical protein